MRFLRSGSIIFPLGCEAAHDESRVGAKAARLSQLLARDFPVPEGWVLTAEAYEIFRRYNRIPAQPRPGQEAAHRRRILAGEVPSVIVRAIDGRLLESGVSVLAVRSSARGEDGGDSSHAGQLETVLGVRPDSVPVAVKRCWASAFSDRVSAYRHRCGASGAPGPGVLIQEQIRPRVAGVLFTMDPVRRSTDELVVEWTDGLADRLVDGRIDPERIRVARSDREPLDGAPPELRSPLRRLVDLALAAERHVGRPVDVEWCLDESGIRIVQVRPITGPIDADLVPWTSVNVGENFPEPLHPLAWSVVERFYRGYMESILRTLGHLGDPGIQRSLRTLMGVPGARLHYNLESWYGLLARAPGGEGLARLLDHYIGQDVPLRSHPAAGQKLRRWLRMPGLVTRGVLAIAAAGRRLDRFEREFQTARRNWRKDVSEIGAHDLVDRIRQMMRFVERRWSPPAIADLMVLLFPGLLDVLLRRRGDGEEEVTVVRLLGGLGVRTTEPGRLLSRLAQGIRSDDRLRARLRKGDLDGLEAALPADLRRVLGTFLERYGARGPGDCLLVAPTPEESRPLLWSLVRAASDEGSGRPAAPERVRLRRGGWRGLVLRAIVRLARVSVRLREVGRLQQSLLFGDVRRVALALGEALVRAGTLPRPEDVFLLELDELDRLVTGRFLLPGSIPDLIRARRRELVSARDTEPPTLFLHPRGATYLPPPRADAYPASGTTLRGTATSPGTARGSARVVTDPTREGALRPGEILVARATDPGWTLLLLRAGGIVLERGGVLSHGAVIARELGIPAVVGVRDATRRLTEGETLLVDGDAGEVRRCA
jgi:phosphohistidine swiveling domain-containing protein